MFTLTLPDKPQEITPDSKTTVQRQKMENDSSSGVTPKVVEQPSTPSTSDDPSSVTYVHFELSRDGAPELTDGIVYDPRVAYRSVLYVLAHVDWSKLAPDAEANFKVKVQKLFGLSTNSLVMTKEEIAELAGRTAEAIMRDESLDKKRALSERQKFGTKTPEFLNAIKNTSSDVETDDDDDGEDGENSGEGD